MEFDFAALPATLLSRPNRYLVVARRQDDGTVVEAHCPTPGRMGELLIPGAGVTVYLSRSPARTGRKTAYDLRFVVHPVTGTLVSVDTRLPNCLVAEALAQRRLLPFAELQQVEAEVRVPHGRTGVQSRIDFCGQEPAGRRCWIEVKSVTLVEGGTGYFPDAVTARGRRHLLALLECVQRGERAAVVFVVQRPDAVQVAAQRENDPAFAEALDLAARAGVECYAWTVAVSVACVELLQAIPVITVHG